MIKLFEVRVQCKLISPYQKFCTNIRRKYYLLGIYLFQTDWFPLSDLWPSLNASIEELTNLGCEEVIEYVIK